MRAMLRACLLLPLIFGLPILALAEPVAAPGELRLRHDLQLLNDSGLIDVPLTAWPVALGDIHAALDGVRLDTVSAGVLSAYERTRDRVRSGMAVDAATVDFDLAASLEPRLIRTFENTPRDEGEITARFSWLGERFAVNLSATAVASPFDGDEFRPDGTYVGVALGNWMLTAGWQERWWGPSRDGSLILSTNARPAPGITVQRNVSAPFETRWLRWIGPWSLTSFMSELDDQRTINNAWLFGLRGTFRPPNTGLEFGISRTAQWCGDNRPCSLSTFGDLLLGKDNRGVNVDPQDEPGNQLGGFDIRWTLPRQIPLALYMQWIGEDGRGGGGAIGGWTRQLGAEHWGAVGTLSHRTHIEVSDVLAREGGFGFSDAIPNISHNHSIYRTGYRYQGRSIGYPADGDSLSYSIGSTLVESAGHSWNLSLRYMEINRDGPPDLRHSLSASFQELVDVQISHDRRIALGRIQAGIGYSELDDKVTGQVSSEISGFVRWSSR